MREFWTLLVVAALCLAGSGCMTASARPWAVADRTDMPGHLRMDGVGGGFGLMIDDSAGTDVQLTGNVLPMENTRTGEDVDIFHWDLMFVRSVPLIGDGIGYDSPLHLRWGLGPSFLWMNRHDGHDMGGAGVCGRLGVGTSSVTGWRLEVFADGHGWLGGDAADTRAAWGVTLGVALGIMLF